MVFLMSVDFTESSFGKLEDHTLHVPIVEPKECPKCKGEARFNSDHELFCKGCAMLVLACKCRPQLR